MKYIKYLLNSPWTVLALILALVSLPKSLRVKQGAIVVETYSFWWHPARGVRATTLGNVIILGKKLEKNDLEHEYIHIEQHMRIPFILPFLTLIELLKHGSELSKYEVEAYSRAGNVYKRKIN